MKSWSHRFTGLLLSVLLSGVPAVWAQAAQPSSPTSSGQTATAQPAPQTAPKDQSAELPDSPGYSQAQAQSQQTTLAQTTQPQQNDQSQPPQAQPAESQPAASQPPQSTQSSQPPSSAEPAGDQNPAGAAAAQRGKTAGGAASRPAGAALAPAKQRNPRSLMVKLGLLAGAGVALGTAFALSQASPSRPPGAH